MTYKYSTSFSVSVCVIPTKTHKPRPIELISSSPTFATEKNGKEQQLERFFIKYNIKINTSNFSGGNSLHYCFHLIYILIIK